MKLGDQLKAVFEGVVSKDGGLRHIGCELVITFRVELAGQNLVYVNSHATT